MPDPDDSSTDGAWNIERPPVQLAHYRLERDAKGRPVELGRGGMGVTYKAYDERLKLPVVLKMISPGRTHDVNAQALFLREARAAARVRHSNVASVLYLSDKPGRFFYAMEFVAGQTLQEWAKGRLPLDPRLAIDLGEQIARGLGAIHAEGIIHRDLKPANIMLLPVAEVPGESAAAEPGQDEWLVKIIDFGLARPMERTESETQSIGFRGTALYASPEQCDEQTDLDARSDLYSLGCILFLLVTGQPPFNSRTHRELMNLHIAEPPPLDLLEGAPAALGQLIARLLSKNPAERPGSGREVLRDLQRTRLGLEAPGGAMFSSPVPAKSKPQAAFQPRRFGLFGAKDRRWRLFGFGVVLLGLIASGWATLPRIVEKFASLSKNSVTPNPDSRVPVDATSLPIQTQPNGLAFLPLASIESTPTAVGYADGLHEDLLTSLSMLPGLRVISKTSVLPFKTGSAMDIKNVTHKLRVSSVLEGSVRREGNEIQLNLRLVEGETERTQWAQRFEFKSTEFNQTRVAIVSRVAEALALPISENLRVRIGQNLSSRPDAAENYLRAKSLIGIARGPYNDFPIAERLLEEAIALDPKFAKAHAQLSILHTLRYDWGMDRTDHRLTEALSAARRAIELDALSAEPNLALGTYYLRGVKDYDRALDALQKALADEPQNTQILSAIANAQRRKGSWQSSIITYQQAVELNPLDPLLNAAYSTTLLYLRRYSESASVLNAAEQAIGNHQAFAFIKGDLYLNWQDDIDPLLKFTGTIPADGRRSEAAVYLRIQAQILQRDIAGARNTLSKSNFSVLDSQNLYVTRGALEAQLADLAGELEVSQAKWRAVYDDIMPLAQTRSSDSRLLILLARAQVGIGEKDLGVKTARSCLMQPKLRADAFDFPLYLECAAQVFLRAGFRSDAAEAIEQLLRLPSLFSENRLKRSPEWDAFTTTNK